MFHYLGEEYTLEGPVEKKEVLPSSESVVEGVREAEEDKEILAEVYESVWLRMPIDIEDGEISLDVVFDEFGDCEGGVGCGADPEILNVGLRLVVEQVDGFIKMFFIRNT